MSGKQLMFLVVFFSTLLININNTIPTVESFDIKDNNIDTLLLIDYSISYDEIIDIISKHKDKNISQKNLLNLLIDLKVQHPEIVLKQAVLESGNFNSSLFNRGNNLFGMRKPAQRQTFALNKKYLGYATYESWQHSAADYKIWQGTKIIKKNYYSYLIKRKYASDEKYIKKLKNIQLEDETS